MNLGFFPSTIAHTAGCLREWVTHGFQVGYLKALRLFDASGGMPTAQAIALQKRELEKKLLAEGYSLTLAKIAVAEAFAQPAKSN